MVGATVELEPLPLPSEHRIHKHHSFLNFDFLEKASETCSLWLTDEWPVENVGVGPPTGTKKVSNNKTRI